MRCLPVTAGLDLCFWKVFKLHTDASKVFVGGVVNAVKHWRHYLFHKQFVLFIDHDSLRHICTQDRVSHKHGRWLAFLEKFTFVMKPKTGVSNRAADALSRRSGLLVTMQVDVPGLDVIRDMELHDEGHVGRDRTLQLVQASYFWHTMRKEVDHYVKRCRVCQPWVDISMDFVSDRDTSFVPKKVKDFVAGLHGVHKAVHENLVRANSKYKQDSDHKQRHVDFEEGNFVWAVLTKDRLPVREYNKLSAKKIGPTLIPYLGDSSDDDLAMNSRANFIYPGGNDGRPSLSIEEWADLFLEAQDRVKKRASVKWPNFDPMGIKQEGDFVWVVFTKDRFLVGEYNKLSAKKIGPLGIVEKINSNASSLKLPSHIRCSNVFNVKHLIPYHGDSSNDDLAMNSRANFVYPGGMMDA
ncbi:putative reverse transcriptase domain-containing protein [Tanacetum coccineum]